MSRGRAFLAAALALAAAIATAGALAPSRAAGGVDSVGSCGGAVYERPFLRWLDAAYYVLAPDGGFESQVAVWTLAGAAAPVAGNETYYVRSASDLRSLSLPPGSSATSPPVCVGVEYPTLRLLVANTGSYASGLRVEVLYTDVFGRSQTARIGTLGAGSRWQPSPVMALFANVTALPLAPFGETHVRLRFTPLGTAGGWRIDDVYVDPFKGT